MRFKQKIKIMYRKYCFFGYVHINILKIYIYFKML